MKKIILLIVITVSSIFIKTHTQTHETDSLENLLSKYKKDDTTKINLLNQIAFKQRKLDLNKTLEYANKAYKIADNINFNKGKAESLRNIGLYYYHKSEYLLALKNYKESLIISQKNDYQDISARCFNNIGNVYRKQGDYIKALEYFQKSLILSEKIKSKQVIASSLGNIGLIYWKQSNYSEALKYYHKSLKIFEKLKYIKGVSNSLNNIGILYYYENDYSKSLEYFQKSLKIDEDTQDSAAISYSLNNIAEIYYHKKNYSKSLEYHQKALTLRKKVGDKSGVCSSYYGIATIYLKINNYSKAIDFTNKGLVIANKLLLTDKQKELRKQLSDIYANTKNYEKAYQNYILYKKLEDSIFNEKNIKKIARLEYQYKHEKEKQASKLIQQKKDALHNEEIKHQKMVRNLFIIGFILSLVFVFFILYIFIQKRKANLVLAVQKNKIQEKNKQLNQLNITLNRLISIISHDLKAPLSAFYSISNSLKSKIDRITKVEINTYLDRMLSSSISLKLQLENLLNWTINKSGNIKINLRETNLSVIAYKTIVVLQEFALEKNIIIENEIDENINFTTDSRMLCIVLNNIISNSVKFSSNNSKIIVTGKSSDGKTLISIKDFGIGMNAKQTQNLFLENVAEKDNINDNKGTGLGLIVCKEIVEKLNGEIWVESNIAKGSTFFIKL